MDNAGVYLDNVWKVLSEVGEILDWTIVIIHGAIGYAKITTLWLDISQA